MRGYTQLYHQQQRVPNYTLTQIEVMCKSGEVALRTFTERKRMRKILSNNIVAQMLYARNASPNQKEAHLLIAKNLKKLKTIIKVH